MSGSNAIDSDPKVLRDVKISLQKSYDSKRNALGAQLLGLIAGLFTLLQTFQNSTKQPISEIFPDLTVSIISHNQFVSLKGALFTIAVCILLFFITRTIFRFALFSKYSDIVYFVETDYLNHLPDGLEGMKDRDILIQVRGIAGLMIAGKLTNECKREKFLKIIPHDWFISGVRYNDEKWGYILCLGMSVVFTLILLFLLW